MWVAGFSPGESEKTVIVAVKGDKVPEFDETFTVDLRLIDGNDRLSIGSAQGVIRNDDEPASEKRLILLPPVLQDGAMTISIRRESGAPFETADASRFAIRSTSDFLHWELEPEALVERAGHLYWESRLKPGALDRFFQVVEK